MRRAGRLTASPTLRSLRVRNFRLFFVGQTVSQAGTWMQSVALTWAVLDNGGDGLALGIATAVQFAPGLLLGPLCGLLIDRLDPPTARGQPGRVHGRRRRPDRGQRGRRVEPAR